MLIKTRGIIFKSIKYSETSLILDIYTEELGLRKYIISGVRSKKARTTAGMLQLMSLLDLVVYHRDDKTLNRIKEVRTVHTYTQLPFDVRRGAVGMFITEVARKAIREPEANRDLFQFLFDTLVHLDQTPRPIANLHLHFLLELSQFLGFLPGDDYSDQTPFFDLQEGRFLAHQPAHLNFLQDAQSKRLDHLLNLSKETCHQVAFTREERAQMLRSLLDYFRLHIENFPAVNAHLILEEIL